MDTSTVLTVNQATEIAGVSTKTIRRWVHSGRLEAGRAGEAYVITAAATHVLSVTPGHVPSTFSVVQKLLDRLSGRLASSRPCISNVISSRTVSVPSKRRPCPKALHNAILRALPSRRLWG
jgi:excisionase family DNA binding protein